MATDSSPPRTLRYDGTASDAIRLVDDEGTSYLVEVTDDLRGAVRRLGALAQKLAQELDSDLRPRDIQALIRSGIGPEELALAAGIDPEVVWRYAGPVVDERAWVADQAQEVPVSSDQDAPLLGELALDRLATRGVSPDSMTWDAMRDHGRWIVALAYSSGDGDAEARWVVDLTHRTLEALDDEAAWISETLMPDGPIAFDAGRALAAIDGGAGGEDEPSGQTSDLSPSLALLDDLMSSRGLRQPVDVPTQGPDGQRSDSVIDSADAAAADTASTPVVDIVHLLPPLETQDTSAPLYSQMTRGDSGPDGDPAVPGPGSEAAGAGSPSRRSILDRRHEVEGAESKAPRPPASPLEEDASVGVEPAQEPVKDQGDDGEDHERRGRRRQTRRSIREEPSTPAPSAPAPPTGSASGSSRDLEPADPASKTTPSAHLEPVPAASARKGGASSPRTGRTGAGRAEPGGARAARSSSSGAARRAASDPTEVVSLLPLDGIDPPDRTEPSAARKAKSHEESKPRPRSR
ncbi:MAG: DUF3071 domain-containing protein, partial [Bifidobacteriaceae bacterium]|nr:DUF3071 domain-containing protein [Bifidobacteriaceae bacterium]